MNLRSKKGVTVLKVLSVAAFILLVLSIEIPRRMWNEQENRTQLARKRMLEMSDCMIVFHQEYGSFSNDLKKVFDFAYAFDTLMVSAPDIEIEILDIDTTSVRVSFSATKHYKDLNVVTSAGEPENIERRELFTRYLESIGCPAASVVMRSDAEEINMLLRGEPHKDHYRTLKERYYLSSENETEILYNVGREISVTLLLRNPNLNLRSHTVNISGPSNILAIANYKGENDIYWDFISKDKIEIEYLKDPELEVQTVNMAKYVFPDIETDRTPYLCPSTLDQFIVSYNLSAEVGMNVTFFNKNMRNVESLTKDKDIISLNDNQILANYFLNLVKLRAERNVAEFVREYEMDGDSTYSSDAQKEMLFTRFFAERMKDFVEREPVEDELKRTIDSPEEESDRRFSENEIFRLLFSVNPGQNVAEEMKKEENREALSSIAAFYEVHVLSTDTVSVRIDSPVNDHSEFKGYDRNILQRRFLFGITDDVNAGYVDNGTPSWRTE